MHLAILTAVIAASSSPTATAPAAPATQSAQSTATVAQADRSMSKAAIMIAAPKQRRPAWEPPGAPIDPNNLAGFLPSGPLSGDGGA